ncbi:ABC transporter substrate-binding protein [Bifidobacterium sp. DSM 109958]|uniref:ABC transporter substrate-binding protein n=1 Tax=Bifidobacterium moraviense TaxID=2675323 RepID=A0A7Y0F3G5_9BIFI|nr:ABC transporter substrate-binding protein [Bifidobacterium sp. DSM 109958]NMN00347.1 ABC transporter substrate-binding protein [Bifidobacterium sp. DSM 109958]
MNRHSAHRAASRTRDSLRSLLVFVVTLAVLAGAVWGGWTIMRRGGLAALRGTLTGETNGSGDAGGNPVTVAVHGAAPQSLDIRTDASSAVEQALIGNVYETLVGRDQNNRAMPGLAASWDVSADGLTYTFRLRSGMRFSNGDVLDAQDVVRSLQRTVSDRYAGASDLTGLASVSNPDAATVTVTLLSPDAALPWRLSGRAGIVYDLDAQTDYAAAALGSGPFTVSGFSPGSSLTLERDGAYWNRDGRAASPSVTLRYYDDGAAAADAVTRGEADAATDVPAASLDALRGAGATPAQGDSTRKVLLGFNARADSIFSEVRLRQGMRYVIDRQRIIDANGAAAALGGPIPSLDPGYEDLTGLYPHDTAKAHALLDYFGYRYRLRLVYPASLGTQVGDLVAGSMRDFGYDVTVSAVDDATWREQVTERHEFDLTIFPMDASHDVTELASPDFFLGYTDSVAEGLAAAVRASADEAAYETNLRALGRRLSENAIADFLYVERPWSASRAGVTGMPLNRTDVFLPLAGLARA